MRTLISLCAAALVVVATATAQQQPRPNFPPGFKSPKVIPSGAGSYSTTNLSAVTPTALAQSLVGAGITVSNVTIISDGTNPADDVAIGAFVNGNDLGIGIDTGVVLSSGDIATAVGPNSADNFTTNNSTGSDPDLQAIATATLNDSAVLQFDFTDPSIAPGQNATVQFSFVFGSDEYNEFVDSNFNDTFAFFLNGNNIALLPDLMTPVAINNFNSGDPFDPMQTDDFAAFFNNNDLSDGGPFFNTEMDGFSDVFTAFGSVTGPAPTPSSSRSPTPATAASTAGSSSRAARSRSSPTRAASRRPRTARPFPPSSISRPSTSRSSRPRTASLPARRARSRSRASP